ncbi:hypothetical protein GCM10027020_22710 [Nocardioides salsibiostraticola]
MLEVHLEAPGKLSWFATALSSLGGTAAFEQYRFVARSTDEDLDASTPVLQSTTFPLLRFTDLDAIPEPHPETDVAQRLADLDRDLVADGWRHREESGRYWWSHTYEKAS